MVRAVLLTAHLAAAAVRLGSMTYSVAIVLTAIVATAFALGARAGADPLMRSHEPARARVLPS